MSAFSPYAAALDDRERRRHKRRNLAQSLLLMAAMIGLLALCTAIVAGWEAVVWALGGAALGLALTPQLPPGLVLRLRGARPIRPWELPEVHAALTELAGRAGLAAPALHYVRSADPNAFALGSRTDPHIVLTDGMLRLLNLRELAGVLAHEISHLRNNDLWVMTLAAVIGRATRLMALAGLLLLPFALPGLVGEGSMDLVLAAMLLVAASPTIVFLQSALSRAREFDADLDAAGLTRDAGGLAAALAKLDRLRSGSAWTRWWSPTPRERSPVSSHPDTAARIARLLSLRVPARPTPWTTRQIAVPWQWSPQVRRTRRSFPYFR